MYLDEEAEKQKIQMRSLIETKRSDLHVQAKINVVRQLDEDYEDCKNDTKRRRLEARSIQVC